MRLTAVIGLTGGFLQFYSRSICQSSGNAVQPTAADENISSFLWFHGESTGEGYGHAGNGRQSEEKRASIRQIEPFPSHARSSVTEFKIRWGMVTCDSMVQFRQS